MGQIDYSTIGQAHGAVDDTSHALLVESVGSALNPVACGQTTSITASGLLSSYGITFNAGLKKLQLYPRAGAAIYLAIGGAASASTFLIPAAGLSLDCSAMVAATLYVYAASGTIMDVIQFA